MPKSLFIIILICLGCYALNVLINYAIDLEKYNDNRVEFVMIKIQNGRSYYGYVTNTRLTSLPTGLVKLTTDKNLKKNICNNQKNYENFANFITQEYQVYCDQTNYDIKQLCPFYQNGSYYNGIYMSIDGERNCYFVNK